ncbi:MAG: hypothetical protein AAF310_01050 [Myxococcota bacterium]
MQQSKKRGLIAVMAVSVIFALSATGAESSCKKDQNSFEDFQKEIKQRLAPPDDIKNLSSSNFLSIENMLRNLDDRDYDSDEIVKLIKFLLDEYFDGERSFISHVFHEKMHGVDCCGMLLSWSENLSRMPCICPTMPNVSLESIESLIVKLVKHFNPYLDEDDKLQLLRYIGSFDETLKSKDAIVVRLGQQQFIANFYLRQHSKNSKIYGSWFYKTLEQFLDE